MSQPPEHDRPEVPAHNSQPWLEDTVPLPLPPKQEMRQPTMWRSAPDYPGPLPPLDKQFTTSQRFSVTTTIPWDQPLIPSRTVGSQQKRRLWRWLLGLSLALVLVLGVLLGLGQLLHMGIQLNTSPIGRPLVQESTVTSPPTTSAATGSTPRGTASATVGSGPGPGTPVSATVTATPFSTATPQPTATSVPGPFTVSPLTLQQMCSRVLPLPPFVVTLSNQTATSVGFQITVVTDLPGTTTPWASVSPASGSIPAGAQQHIDVTPNAGLCTDPHFKGTQPFLLRVTAVTGTSGTSTVTDSVTSAA